VRIKLPTKRKRGGKVQRAKNNPRWVTWLASCSRADSLDEAGGNAGCWLLLAAGQEQHREDLACKVGLVGLVRVGQAIQLLFVPNPD
jgi:hypothetical protein